MNVLRTFLFFVLCIGVRFLIAFGVRNTKNPNYVAIGLGLVALGFAMIYTFQLRKSGAETFGEPNIWWDQLRPVHAGLYGIAAMYAARGNQELAFWVLVLDTLMGTFATGYHRFYLKN